MFHGFYERKEAIFAAFGFGGIVWVHVALAMSCCGGCLSGQNPQWMQTERNRIKGSSIGLEV